MQFIVGNEEVKIMAHMALIAARSKYLQTKVRHSKVARDDHLEKLFGTAKVPFSDIPPLEVCDLYIWTLIIEFRLGLCFYPF